MGALPLQYFLLSLRKKVITSIVNPVMNMYCSLSQVIFDKMRWNLLLCTSYLANKLATLDSAYLFDS